MLFLSYSTIHSHTKSIHRNLGGPSQDEFSSGLEDWA
jgi:DNA-binding CsgD family transcriptional regulator